MEKEGARVFSSSQLQKYSAPAANVTNGEFQKKFQTKGSHH